MVMNFKHVIDSMSADARLQLFNPASSWAVTNVTCVLPAWSAGDWPLRLLCCVQRRSWASCVAVKIY